VVADVVVAPASGKQANDSMHQHIDRVLDLLKRYAGFTPSSSLRYKLDNIFRKIEPSILKSWVDELHSASNTNDLNALVEDLTNHETFFFREKVQLDVFSQDLLPKIIAQKINQREYTIRIWSAACSTGEEVYTLAMLTLCAMVKAGIARETEPGKISLNSPWKLEVVGSDISRQALKIAQNAIYIHKPDKLNSFRQFPEEYRRFFSVINEPDKVTGMTSYQLNDSVRRHVKFSWFNLKSTSPLLNGVDFVFCRNVLIYFDKADHGDVQTMLSRALTKQGYLFLGLVDNLSATCKLKTNRQYNCTIYENE
jgi:chemotaxis protein methyltransferase CheR